MNLIQESHCAGFTSVLPEYKWQCWVQRGRVAGVQVRMYVPLTAWCNYH